ncbi:amidohydrolase [Candidatus Cetobacterium colombiensis]|uniref:Amidohydrolase n=1 Tax=Candidatus Cetobacterium colombiensis TaxID=3073100 RepID=A0ABU4WCD3_9FUSO|nr:amidohydrolase [Candidatus Cetobacterium colombiensis]MDX8336158.1 amidohydrolase [Candidatus Cetobacterium colombiensis]
MKNYLKNTFILGTLFLFGCSSLTEKKESASIIIKNGTILTMDKNNTVIENGVIIIKNEKIISIGKDELLKKYSTTKIIDAENGIIMPGMINTHNHLPMIAFRGLGEEGIKNRLFAYFFPLESEKLSRDLIYKATVHGTIDMALSGVTTYADMYYHMDEMAKATKEVGIRGVLGETVIKYPVVDAKEPYGGINYAINFIEEYKNDELIIPAFGPHAPYTVSKEKMQEINSLSKKYNVPIMIHVGEFDDEDKRLNLKNKSVVEYMDSIGVLNERVLLAHAIHLNEKDLDIIKNKKASIAYNPMANAKGATGIARAHEMINKNIKVGLGTDGPMSSNQVDLFRTLSYASSMQRLKYNDRTIMTPDLVVKMATIGGAEALNLDNKIGSIESGKLADIIIVETKSPNMMPNYNPFATLVFQANSSNVETTIVNGKIIVENKKLKTYDIEKNRKQMKEIEKDIADFAKDLAKKAKETN